MKRYESENDILAVIRSFEAATISRDAWKHAEHLTVALYYLTHYDIETAAEKIRSGIFKLLTTDFGLDLSKEMPYHETLTVFWMRIVYEFSISTDGVSLVDRTNELVEKYDKDYPMRFYSREFLFSDEVRSRFVDGDLGNTDDFVLG